MVNKYIAVNEMGDTNIIVARTCVPAALYTWSVVRGPLRVYHVVLTPKTYPLRTLMFLVYEYWLL